MTHNESVENAIHEFHQSGDGQLPFFVKNTPNDVILTMIKNTHTKFALSQLVSSK